MANKKEIVLPFMGFYESTYGDIMESFIEGETYNHIEDSPELDELDYELNDILSNNFNYSQARKVICVDYVNEYSKRLDIPLEFKELVSPKEYNFTTDRIFCLIDTAAINKMFEVSKTESHKTLNKVIGSRHTSYDGFYSFYSNDMDEWLTKGVTNWDHNELETLLVAYGYLTDKFIGDGQDIDYEELAYSDSDLLNEVIDITRESMYDCLNYNKATLEINAAMRKQKESA